MLPCGKTQKPKQSTRAIGLKSSGCPEDHSLSAPATARPAAIPTLSFQTLAELRLGLSVGPQAAFRVELVGHGGCGDHSLQAALALGHVLLRMEEHHVHFGHVEHPQGDGGAQAHRDGQGCGLDVHLLCGGDQEKDNNEFTTPGKNAAFTLGEFSALQNITPLNVVV